MRAATLVTRSGSITVLSACLAMISNKIVELDYPQQLGKADLAISILVRRMELHSALSFAFSLSFAFAFALIISSLDL